jgi:type II secretory pathway pseudopilin PulG
MRPSLEQGDTIIEVLFAVAVFAMVAVGSLSIMNQGTATAQRSLEITLVRQQIDAQAEAIRYIHQSYVTAFQYTGGVPTGTAAQWIKMTSKATGNYGADSASEFGAITEEDTCPTSVPGQKPFILDTQNAKVWNGIPSMQAPADGSMPPFAQVVYNVGTSVVNQAYGIWVEAVPSSTQNGASSGFVDFHIRACWDAPGSTVPATLGTIVRLYEPR